MMMMNECPMIPFMIRTGMRSWLKLLTDVRINKNNCILISPTILAIYEASNPYVPICKSEQTKHEAPATTLSGRPLGSTTYEEISKSIMKSMQETFISDGDENEENLSLTRPVQFPTKQAGTISFVRASFFYKDAKEVCSQF